MVNSWKKKRKLRKTGVERKYMKNYKCRRCEKTLRKTMHHFLCNKCWNEKHKKEKGNLKPTHPLPRKSKKK